MGSHAAKEIQAACLTEARDAPAEYTEKKNKPWALKTKLRQSGEIMMKRAAARAMRTGAGLTDETAEFDDDDDDEQLPAQ